MVSAEKTVLVEIIFSLDFQLKIMVSPVRLVSAEIMVSVEIIFNWFSAEIMVSVELMFSLDF